MYIRKYSNREIEQQQQRFTAGFNQKIRKMSDQYNSQILKLLKRQQMTEFLVEAEHIQRQIFPLMATYEDRYKDAMLTYQINVYSSVKSVCKYPFFYEESMGWAKCRRKQLDDIIATTVSAVTLAHEITPPIFPLIFGKPTSYLNSLESRVKKLQSWNHDSPTVKVFFSQLEKEIDRLDLDDLSLDFLILTYERANEMESIFKHYEVEEALSFNNCRFCCKSDSPLCEEMNPGKEDSQTVQEIHRHLLRTFQRNLFQRLAAVVSKVKNG